MNRKTTWLALIPCALLFSSSLLAQATDDEEIIVRGQRLEDFAVERAYDEARGRRPRACSRPDPPARCSR